ncbi:MAG: hypothetical protein E7I10_26190, partial [Enterobacter asburiae]|nr:hypothetical protein [Enterobacter asburiae]
SAVAEAAKANDDSASRAVRQRRLLNVVIAFPFKRVQIIKLSRTDSTPKRKDGIPAEQVWKSKGYHQV